MRKLISLLVIVCFTITGLNIPLAQAQDFRLPAPGVMVHLSPPFDPPILKGIKVHPDNPFRFDFILDKGDSEFSNNQLKDESSKLIKYFLASLTIPEKDLWVNLSPYEKDRIIPNSFGLTEMGRDLLAEDYMLKQITASLIYPEDGIGKKFWKRIYEEAAKRYGTTDIPVNTFNKVWIVPEKAVVYENAKAGTAYVVESKLKIMLEQDYLSLAKHEGIQSGQAQSNSTSQLGNQIVREIVIPELTTEVNENKNFCRLRQVYNSLILATWYKKKIKDSILEQVYADKNKVAGVNIDDPQEKERIYQKYLRAFKKGVFNYIKEDVDPITQESIPRKYFSGGVIVSFENVINLPQGRSTLNMTGSNNSLFITRDAAMLAQGSLRTDKAEIVTANVGAAMPTNGAGTLKEELGSDGNYKSYRINASEYNPQQYYWVSNAYVKDVLEGQVQTSANENKPRGVWISGSEGWAVHIQKDSDLRSKSYQTTPLKVILRAGLKIAEVDTVEDFKKLAISAGFAVEDDGGLLKNDLVEVGMKLQKLGYDGIHITHRGVKNVKQFRNWEVDSTVIFNPQNISFEPLLEKEISELGWDSFPGIMSKDQIQSIVAAVGRVDIVSDISNKLTRRKLWVSFYDGGSDFVVNYTKRAFFIFDKKGRLLFRFGGNDISGYKYCYTTLSRKEIVDLLGSWAVNTKKRELIAKIFNIDESKIKQIMLVAQTYQGDSRLNSKKVYNLDKDFLQAIGSFNLFLGKNEPLNWNEVMELFRLLRGEIKNENTLQGRVSSLEMMAKNILDTANTLVKGEDAVTRRIRCLELAGTIYVDFKDYSVYRARQYAKVS